MEQPGLITTARLGQLTGIPVYRLAQLASEGFFARAQKDQYKLVEAILGLLRYYRESSERLPNYPSIDACCGATGIPRAAIKSAKAKGCSAFKNTRVSLEPLLRWLFSNDEAGENNWGEALKEVQTKRERLKLRKENEELVDKAEVSEAIQKLLTTLTSEFDKQLLHEAPPLLKGLDEVSISTNLERIMWDAFAAAKKKVAHLLAKEEAKLARENRQRKNVGPQPGA